MNIDAHVAIIGAGPLGIELAIAMKQAGIDALQFDKGQIAQMVQNYPPGTTFFSSPERISIAGTPIQTANQQKCTREEYLAYLRTMVMANRLQVNSYEEVLDIQKTGSEAFWIHTSASKIRRSYQVKYIVLATGGTSHPRKLDVAGEDLPHVHDKMKEPHTYFQRKVVIIGGKNSAVESALRLFHAGADVTMVYRKGAFDETSVKYWLLPELMGRINKRQIRCLFNSSVEEIGKDAVAVRSEKQTFSVPADFVIKAIGFDADMSLFEMAGVRLSPPQNAPVFKEETMETNIPGAFVLGTATGGTQSHFNVFIENTHIHVQRITNELCSRLNKQPPDFCGWYAYSKPKGRLEE